ncbi:MAG: hypothetical protein QOH03_2159, partial [Kribbellaceae bacterium]|nr:hypothetical protein [Kribbellaceae bacterium]
RGGRLRRPQWRRQDHHDEDARRHPAPDRRRGSRPRPRPLAPPARVPQADRARPRQPAHRRPGRAHRDGFPALPADPVRGPQTRVPRQPRRAGRVARPRLLAGQAGPRSEPGRKDACRTRHHPCVPAEGAVPRRAHDRPRRHGCRLTPPVHRPVRRTVRRDRPADQPLRRRRGVVVPAGDPDRAQPGRYDGDFASLDYFDREGNR